MSIENTINDVVGHSTDKNTLKDICEKQKTCVNIDGALFCSGYSDEILMDCFDSDKTRQLDKITGFELLNDQFFRTIEKAPSYYPRYTQINTTSSGNAGNVLDTVKIIENMPGESETIIMKCSPFGSSLSCLILILLITLFIWIITKIF